MTTSVSITVNTICPGQNHAHVTFAMTGGGTRNYTFEMDEIREALNSETLRDAALVLLRLHMRGMTKAQARTELQAGVNVVI